MHKVKSSNHAEGLMMHSNYSQPSSHQLCSYGVNHSLTLSAVSLWLSLSLTNMLTLPVFDSFIIDIISSFTAMINEGLSHREST